MPRKKSIKPPLTGALTIRLGPLKARLTKAAEKLELSENDIGRHGIRALLDAIEANDYRIGWPPRMHLDGDKHTLEL